MQFRTYKFVSAYVFIIFSIRSKTLRIWGESKSNASDDYELNKNDDAQFRWFMDFQKNKIMDEIIRRSNHDAGKTFEIAKRLVNWWNTSAEMADTPIFSVILSTWGTGSTLLGDILNLAPANLYHYEPLDVFTNETKKGEEGTILTEYLIDLLRCDEPPKIGRKNRRLWLTCQEFDYICTYKSFLRNFCKLFPSHTMKVNRLSLETTEPILSESKLAARMLLLVRDPRAVIYSRSTRPVCPGGPDCYNPMKLCRQMRDDYVAALEFSQRYSDSFRVLRYEDLATNLQLTTKKLYQFFGMNFDLLVKKKLRGIRKMQITDANERIRPFKWRTDMLFGDILQIQNACAQVMFLWGYQPVLNARNPRMSTYVPFEEYTFQSRIRFLGA